MSTIRCPFCDKCFEPEEPNCKHAECTHLGCKKQAEKCYYCDPDPTRDILKHAYCKDHDMFSKDDVPVKTCFICFAKNCTCLENRETRPCCKGVKHLKCQKCERWAERCDGCDPDPGNIETHLYCIYHDMFTDELYM